MFASFAAILRDMIRLILLFSAFACVAGPAYAQEETSGCSVDNARTITIKEAHDDLSTLRGECVTVQGILYSRTIYPDRESIISAPDDVAGSTKSLALRWRDLPSGDGPMIARVTGRLDNCGLLAAEAQARADAHEVDDGVLRIVMMSGLCHYTYDSFIDPTGVGFLDLKILLRPVGAEIPVGQRDLVEVDAEFPGLTKKLSYAEAMVRAVAAQNEAAFYALRNPDNRPANFTLDSDDPFAGFALRYGASPRHAEIAYPGGRLEVKWFRPNDWLEVRKLAFEVAQVASRLDFPNPESRRLYRRREELDHGGRLISGATGESSLFACWCIEEDCTGKWPARLSDMDNLNDRPFYCVTAEDYKVYGQDELQTVARVPWSTYGFAEPEWPKNE